MQHKELISAGRAGLSACGVFFLGGGDAQASFDLAARGIPLKYKSDHVFSY